MSSDYRGRSAPRQAPPSHIWQLSERALQAKVAGSNPAAPTYVMSRDIEDTPNLR